MRKGGKFLCDYQIRATTDCGNSLLFTDHLDSFIEMLILTSYEWRFSDYTWYRAKNQYKNFGFTFRLVVAKEKHDVWGTRTRM